jgi:hypothetical protein
VAQCTNRCSSAIIRSPNHASSGSCRSDSPPGPSDQLGQTGLSPLQPPAIHAVAVTHQNPHPALDQLLKGRLGPARLHLEQGPRGIDHHPQPRLYAMLVPGGFIDIVDLGYTSFLGDGFMMGLNVLGDSIHTSLNRPSADGRPGAPGEQSVSRTADRTRGDDRSYGSPGTRELRVQRSA